MSASETPVIKIKPSLLPFTWKGFILVILGLVFLYGNPRFHVAIPIFQLASGLCDFRIDRIGFP